MQTGNDALGSERVGKLLVRLAVPSIVAQLINMLYNMVDRMYIGRIPQVGALALTGLGVCSPIIMVVSAFAALVSMGGAPKAAIAMGAGDSEEAEKILGNCITVQLIVSVAMTVALLRFHRPLLIAFGASENTIDFAADYMRIYSLGTIFVQLTLGMNAFINAQGFAKTGMLTVLLGAICNIILDPIFIFALNMGVRGAALATILSQGASTVWVLVFLSGKRSTLRIRKANLRPQVRRIASVLALGMSPFIMQASESVISVCFNSSLLKYGGDIAVGAMTILSSVMMISMLPLQGLAQGAMPIASYNFGAGNAVRVKKVFWLLLKSCLAYSAFLWGMVMLFPQMFARLFTTNADLIAFSAQALRRYCAVLFVMGIQMACQMTFISIGNAKASAVVAIVRKFVLLIPLIYLMPVIFPQNKTMAVYLAEPVSDFIAVTFTVALFARQFTRAMRVLNSHPA